MLALSRGLLETLVSNDIVLKDVGLVEDQKFTHVLVSPLPLSSLPLPFSSPVVVEMDLSGLKVTLSDTAGFRPSLEGVDVVELEGMKRASKIATDAHIIICIVDSKDVEGGMESVRDVLEGCDVGMKNNVVFVQNKIDLIAGGEAQHISSKKFSSLLPTSFGTGSPGSVSPKLIPISCSSNEGVDDFIRILTSKVKRKIETTSGDDVEPGSNVSSIGGDVILTRSRHRQHLTEASQALQRFDELAGAGLMEVDVASEELRRAMVEIGRIVGGVDVEDVLDVLFREFCIGK